MGVKIKDYEEVKTIKFHCNNYINCRFFHTHKVDFVGKMRVYVVLGSNVGVAE